jgi:hypothetical protein
MVILSIHGPDVWILYILAMDDKSIDSPVFWNSDKNFDYKIRRTHKKWQAYCMGQAIPYEKKKLFIDRS